MFYKIRRKIGIQLDLNEKQEFEEYVDSDSGFLASLVNCWWCFSTWIALFWTILAVCLLGLSLAEAPFIWFGAIAIAGVIEKVLDGTI